METVNSSSSSKGQMRTLMEYFSALFPTLPWTLLMLLLLVLLQIDATLSESRAGCRNCHVHDFMQGDQPLSDDSSPCVYPCKCNDHQTLNCPAGVSTIMDGCDCCAMCARQQGDLCDYRYKCDEKRGLYCDYEQLEEDPNKGICRARAAKPCQVDGKSYKDGEQFKPAGQCNLICTCQNGLYACSSLCPQEERPPSKVHCKDPQLIQITGRCCKEWVCPHSHSNGLEVNDVDNIGVIGQVQKCKKETSQWSPCSLTCGLGVSTRLTFDETCEPTQERRLCLVRPCQMDDSKLLGANDCRSTRRRDYDEWIEHDGCRSLDKYRLKYCSTCKKEKCCGAGKTRTIPVNFRCQNRTVVMQNFMWIKSCECFKMRRCPFH